jgi:hypothetical protein
LIDDLLISDDGKIADAIIQVGGLLGMGGKRVSVPFDQLKFQESVSSRTVAGGSSAGPSGTPATSRSAGSTITAPAAPPTTASESPMYFSIVSPGATKETLTKLDEFRFAG